MVMYKVELKGTIQPHYFQLQPPPPPDTQTLEQSAQEYTTECVGKFLKTIGLGHHVATFIERDISGDMLLGDIEEMLEELGVINAAEKFKIKVLFRLWLLGDVVWYPMSTVLDFLKQYKLDKYYPIFQEWAMDGDLLLQVDDNVLKKMGVNSALDRKRISSKYKTFIETC